jgi:hypothetical protein
MHAFEYGQLSIPVLSHRAGLLPFALFEKCLCAGAGSIVRPVGHANFRGRLWFLRARRRAIHAPSLSRIRDQA